tara:strand:+ start:387 stop:641 length:255 start_codon:yes stop_codon:yes gene_type:complete
MRLFKKKTIPDESLIDFTTTQFDNNSLLVNYSKNISKELINYSVFGTKKLVAPLSKILDYGVISLVSIVIYNFIVNKDLINYYY